MGRRGVILLGVLVVVAISALVGTGIVFASDAEHSASASSVRRDQLRAMAWSGVQAVMSELAAQREELLTGGSPILTPEWTLFEDDLGRTGVIRLVATPEGDLAVPEGAKLDVNHATAEMLSELDGIDLSLAQKIVAGRPYQSVEELLRVEGVTPGLLYGRAERGGLATAESMVIGDAMADAAIASEDARLIDRLTAFAFDPNVMSGLVGREHAGHLRINFNMEWSDRLKRAVQREFDDDVARLVEEVFKQGHRFTSDADSIRVMQRYGMPPADWAEGLDVIATTDEEFRPGRVDLLHAPAAVLACVPGIGPASAAVLVEMRDGLEPEERLSVVWPAARGVVSAEEFVRAVDHLAMRSMQWRVRVEASLESGAGPDGSGDTTRYGSVTLDAVIDVASQRPRVAYLRDVTLLATARRIAAETEALAEELGTSERAEELAALEVPEGPAGIDADPRGADSDAELGGADSERPRRANIRRGEPRRLGRSQPPAGDNLDGETSSELDAPGGLATPGDEDAAPPLMRDRRLGRWTTRGGTP